MIIKNTVRLSKCENKIINNVKEREEFNIKVK